MRAAVFTLETCGMATTRHGCEYECPVRACVFGEARVWEEQRDFPPKVVGCSGLQKRYGGIEYNRPLTLEARRVVQGLRVPGGN